MSSGNVGLPLRSRLPLCAYRRWMVYGAARKARGRTGEARMPPPTTRHNGRDYFGPVRRQKCHNNGSWIVFAAPAPNTPPNSPYVTTRRSSLSYWEIRQFYSLAEKKTSRKLRNPVVSFQTLDKYRSSGFSVQNFSGTRSRLVFDECNVFIQVSRWYGHLQDALIVNQ